MNSPGPGQIGAPSRLFALVQMDELQKRCHRLIVDYAYPVNFDSIVLPAPSGASLATAIQLGFVDGNSGQVMFIPQMTLSTARRLAEEIIKLVSLNDKEDRDRE